MTLQSKWKLIRNNKSVDEITVEEIDRHRTEKIRIKIRILGGKSVIENIGEQTFHIGTDEEVSSIDWSNSLFR